MLAVDKTTSAERDADSAATRSHEPSIASIVGATMMPISTAAQIGPPSHAIARHRTARSSRSILVASGELRSAGVRRLVERSKPRNFGSGCNFGCACGEREHAKIKHDPASPLSDRNTSRYL